MNKRFLAILVTAIAISFIGGYAIQELIPSSEEHIETSTNSDENGSIEIDSEFEFPQRIETLDPCDRFCLYEMLSITFDAFLEEFPRLYEISSISLHDIPQFYEDHYEALSRTDIENLGAFTELSQLEEEFVRSRFLEELIEILNIYDNLPEDYPDLSIWQSKGIAEQGSERVLTRLRNSMLSERIRLTEEKLEAQ